LSHKRSLRPRKSREALEQLRTDAAKHVDASPWSLSDAELTDCLDTVPRLEQTVVALRSHLVRQIAARGIAAAAGCRGTAGWLRDRLRLDPMAARDLVPQAGARDRRPNLSRTADFPGAGPCSEIYPNRGPDYGKEAGPEIDEDRYVEL
jgi:hypothetical protein